MLKNGFSIMANSCLLIETLESFYRGWGMTQGSNEKAFLKFFGRDNNFSEFATDDMATEFYKNIRCAILHQGETSGGWRISREGSYLIDKKNKKINAFKFITLLEKTLKEYEIKLNKNDWNDEIWTNARKKIKSTLKNIK